MQLTANNSASYCFSVLENPTNTKCIELKKKTKEDTDSILYDGKKPTENIINKCKNILMVFKEEEIKAASLTKFITHFTRYENDNQLSGIYESFEKLFNAINKVVENSKIFKEPQSTIEWKEGYQILQNILTEAKRNIKKSHVNLSMISEDELEKILAHLDPTSLIQVSKTTRLLRKLGKGLILRSINKGNFIFKKLGMKSIKDGFTYFKEDCSKIKRLNLNCFKNELKDLSCLENYPNLTHLEICGGYRIQNLILLKQYCPKLTHLHLNGCWLLTNLEGLEGLKNLTHLNINDCKRIHNIKALEHCEKLTHFYAGYCLNLSNLDPLKNCPITHLFLRGSRRIDINSLPNLPFLTDLNIAYCSIKKLSFLERYPSLKILSLMGCTKIKEEEFNYLKYCNLKKLNLCRCYQITELEFLEHCNSLLKLYLSNCYKIKEDSFELLRKCCNLFEIDLNNCPSFKNLNCLEKCTRLKKIHLIGCPQISPQQISEFFKNSVTAIFSKKNLKK